MECAICQDAVRLPQTTLCGHSFCLMCIAPWVVTHGNCPKCRAKCDRLIDCVDLYSKEEKDRELTEAETAAKASVANIRPPRIENTQRQLPDNFMEGLRSALSGFPGMPPLPTARAPPAYEEQHLIFPPPMPESMFRRIAGPQLAELMQSSRAVPAIFRQEEDSIRSVLETEGPIIPPLVSLQVSSMLPQLASSPGGSMLQQTTSPRMGFTESEPVSSPNWQTFEAPAEPQNRDPVFESIVSSMFQGANPIMREMMRDIGPIPNGLLDSVMGSLGLGQSTPVANSMRVVFAEFTAPAEATPTTQDVADQIDVD